MWKKIAGAILTGASIAASLWAWGYTYCSSQMSAQVELAKAAGANDSSPGVYPTEFYLTTGVGLPLFEGKFHVSLIGTKLAGDPPHYQAFATLGAPGKPSLELKAVDPGYSAAYENIFLRILEVNASGARFLVTPATSRPQNS